MGPPKWQCGPRRDCTVNPLLWTPLAISCQKSQPTLHGRFLRHPFLPPNPWPPDLSCFPRRDLGVQEVPMSLCFSWESGPVERWRGRRGPGPPLTQACAPRHIHPDRAPRLSWASHHQHPAGGRGEKSREQPRAGGALPAARRHRCSQETLPLFEPRTRPILSLQPLGLVFTRAFPRRESGGGGGQPPSPGR